MAHARQQIREAVVTTLTGLTTAGANVFGNRVYTMDDAHLPAIVVYTLNERVADEFDVLGTKQFRVLTLLVIARAKAAADLDDTLDAICAEVEADLYADPTFGGLVIKDVDLVETTMEMEKHDKPVGRASMRWEVLYRVDATAPQTLIA